MTMNGKNIFAKNSDREPNEAQQIQRFPSVERPSGFVKCTFITVPFVGKTNEIIVSKPFQMWGVEMGLNEFGLAIGNEAIFSTLKSKRSNTGLTGMDWKLVKQRKRVYSFLFICWKSMVRMLVVVIQTHIFFTTIVF